MRRIVIAAYHPLVIKGINQALAEQLPDSEVIGQATHIRKFLSLIEQYKPDAAVIDVAVTWKCGIDLLEEVERIHPKLSLHFISIHPLDHHVVSYLERQTQRNYQQGMNSNYMRLF